MQNKYAHEKDKEINEDDSKNQLPIYAMPAVNDYANVKRQGRSKFGVPRENCY